MSEQQTAQPTAPAVNWANLRCLYGEDIPQGKQVKCKISGIRDTPKGARLFCQSGESEAWDITLSVIKEDGSLSTVNSQGKTRYIQIPKVNSFGKPAGILRNYSMACGGEPDKSHIGKIIVLRAKDSAKSVTGKAIKIEGSNH
jgi:predicted RecA/RadA family phage recombinase